MTAANKNIFIVAGEPSGDLHASHLIHSLSQMAPQISFHGVGGPMMRAHPFKGVLKMEDFAVMGFTDVFKALPRLIKNKKILQEAITALNPECVILVDYPDFNMRLARGIRKEGYKGKIIQYISPSVWAWRSKRVFTIAKYYDALLTIYPFEAKHYSETALPVHYVGNPVKECIEAYGYDANWRALSNIPESDQLIAVFPGSRKNEIERNFPKILEAIERFKKDNPQAIFGVSALNALSLGSLLHFLKKSSLKLGEDIFIVPQKYTYELMRDCRTALAKSGTVCLELAIHNKPTVVVYEVSKMNRFIAKYIARINLPYYCIVNILAGKGVFPEIIEHNISSDRIATHLRQLNSEGPFREGCLMGCREVDKMLSEHQASKKAASIIKELALS